MSNAIMCVHTGVVPKRLPRLQRQATDSRLTRGIVDCIASCGLFCHRDNKTHRHTDSRTHRQTENDCERECFRLQ